MKKNNIINIVFVLYVVGFFIFTPVAGLIQLGTIIYLAIKKKWGFLLVWVGIVVIFTIIAYILIVNHIDNLFTEVLHAIGIITNAFWLVYVLQKMKD